MSLVEGTAGEGERRRTERRVNARIADLTLPEFRRILVTTLLFVIVVVLFTWMVRKVIIGAILAVVIAVYLRPLYLIVRARVKRPSLAAILTLMIIIVPVLGAIAYSYLELRDVVKYLATHQGEVAGRIEQGIERLTLFRGKDVSQSVREAVLRASDYGGKIPGIVQEVIVEFSVATTIFLFTAFYIFTDSERIAGYLRAQVPPRYAELGAALEHNVNGVLYGAIYATLLTQSLKTAIIFMMNLAFQVPLAGVLAMLSFIIGFFPIVGSWSVYVPVAMWLLVYRDQPVAAALMIIIGFLLNTVFISTFLRPKLAAQKSQVLNFYWMFLGLVTGVYTFGLAGILLGPILIGLLKAIVDTVTAKSSWRLIESESDFEERGTVT